MAGTITKSRMTSRKGEAVKDAIIQFNTFLLDFNTRTLTAPNPVIKTGGSAIAKTGNATTVCLVDGAPVVIAASTDLGSLTGIDISAGAYNIVLWTCDDTSGTTTAHAGTEGASAAAVVMPNINARTPVVGGALITYASAFTGGTTALDTATTVYFSTEGVTYQGLTAALIGTLGGSAVSSTVG